MIRLSQLIFITKDKFHKFPTAYLRFDGYMLLLIIFAHSQDTTYYYQLPLDMFHRLIYSNLSYEHREEKQVKYFLYFPIADRIGYMELL